MTQKIVHRAPPGSAEHPVIQTDRLILRPWKREDAPALQSMAGRREIADSMISLPHPFGLQDAENWITAARVLEKMGM